MIVEHHIDLSVTRENRIDPILIAEDDKNSHVLVIHLMEDENTQLLIGEQQVWDSRYFYPKLYYKRADGYFGEVKGEFTSDYDDPVDPRDRVRGRIRIIIPDDLLILDDKVLCEVCIFTSIYGFFHSVSVQNNTLICSERFGLWSRVLRTGSFYIDSRIRVISNS